MVAGHGTATGVRVLAAFAQNTACRLANLGFAARVDFDQLLKGTRFQAPFGQSPFAFQRGLAFERMLRESNHARTRGLLSEPLGLPSAEMRVTNLRGGIPAACNRMPARADATLNRIQAIIHGEPDAPHLIDGAVLRGTVGGLEEFFEADALAARAAPVARAVAVPQDGDDVPAVRHSVEREIRPAGRGEWPDLQDIIIARVQPDQRGDDQVVERGVEIVLAVFVLSCTANEPVSGWHASARYGLPFLRCVLANVCSNRT